jgi:2-amino-4-hydroxy-6-hydroxymethyldihydropteridine diphosphokinase
MLRPVARVVIGLGSNLGDRLANLRSAVGRLAQSACVLATSRVYETAPIGGPAQGAFLNAAVAIEWGGEAHALLDLLQDIERDLGRRRDLRWGPRTIDLDVLWIEGARVDDARLVVPHPRLHERAFAVQPLLDVAPDAPFQTPRDQEVRVTELTLTGP